VNTAFQKENQCPPFVSVSSAVGLCRDVVELFRRVVEPLVGRTLVLIGVAIAGLGLLMMMGLPLGRLPGDFAIKRENFSFYFPLATSIILSIILTLIFAFFRR
jgi:Protein of unknown function (DUF2905)